MRVAGRASRGRSCSECGESHAPTQEEINAPIGQVMFYEGCCLKCAAVLFSQFIPALDPEVTLTVSVQMPIHKQIGVRL